MTYTVIVIDRDAGWVVEKHGPYTNRERADERMRELRAMFALSRPLASFKPARNLNDTYEVKVIELRDAA